MLLISDFRGTPMRVSFIFYFVIKYLSGVKIRFKASNHSSDARKTSAI